VKKRTFCIRPRDRVSHAAVLEYLRGVVGPIFADRCRYAISTEKVGGGRRLTFVDDPESDEDDDDDEGRINFSVALSPKTTRTRNNKPKQ